MTRKRYDIVHKFREWKVISGGVTLGAFDDRESAVDAGVRQALSNRPSRVLIRSVDGAIEEERSFGNARP